MQAKLLESQKFAPELDHLDGNKDISRPISAVSALSKHSLQSASSMTYDEETRFHTNFYFHPNDEHPISTTTIAKMSKKRKLQCELGNSDLPWPKHKFQDKSSSFSIQGSLISEISEVEENLISESSESTVIDACDELGGAEVSYDDTNENMTTIDFQSTSDSKDARGLGSRHDVTEDIYPGFGAFGEVGIELADASAEDIMTYSSDVAPNAYLLSTGSWKVGQDARLGSRKPTIDEEFEQYFSMLML